MNSPKDGGAALPDDDEIISELQSCMSPWSCAWPSCDCQGVKGNRWWAGVLAARNAEKEESE